MQGRKCRRGRIFAAVAALVILSAVVLSMADEAAAGIRFTQTPGNVVYKNDSVIIDASCTDQGYVSVLFTQDTTKRLIVRINKGNDAFTYELNSKGQYDAYPLQAGNGSYRIRVYQQVQKSEYSQVFSKTITVKIADKNLPFLYPNKLVWYTSDTKAVALSLDLCKNAATDKEKVQILADYVTRAIYYDYFKAITVKSGYVPDIDAVLSRKMGICFDYSSVFACMLRVQNIPTKLIIGYADKMYHAWNSVLLDGDWVLYDTTFTASGRKIKKYTQEGSY
jgi:transglutaminase-like putative cysteine protease